MTASRPKTDWKQDSMLESFYQWVYPWIDLIWLPVGWVMVHKGQRLKTMGFLLGSILIFRLQLELMRELGYENGFLGLIKLGLYERGLIVYGLVFAIFLILAHFSPRTKGVIFLAAALSVMIFGFILSMIAMLP
jgi:hypothetical protein